jgi:hypothetical protein
MSGQDLEEIVRAVADTEKVGEVYVVMYSAGCFTVKARYMILLGTNSTLVWLEPRILKQHVYPMYAFWEALFVCPNNQDFR